MNQPLIREIVSALDLQQSMETDQVPVTDYQAKVIAEQIKKTVHAGGGFYVHDTTEQDGFAFVFYDHSSRFIRSIDVRAPKPDPTRKIPKKKTLEELINPYRPVPDPMEVDLIHELIKNHIRNGGQWEAKFCNGYNEVVLSLNGRVFTTIRIEENS